MKHGSPALSSVVDPVCGMTIEPATASGSHRYGSRTYHFCSKGCELKFAAEPAKYADDSGTGSPASAASSCCSGASGSSCC